MFYFFINLYCITIFKEQVLGSRLQKLQKKNRKGKMDVPDLAEILEKIPTPSVWNTLPFQLPKWTYSSIVGIPSTIRSIYRLLEERKQRKKQEEEEALLVFRKHAEIAYFCYLDSSYKYVILTEKTSLIFILILKFISSHNVFTVNSTKKPK